MYRWVNKDMVPIVTTEIHSFNDDIENLLDESNAQIEFEIFNTANGNETINPFNQTQLVLTPILKNYLNGKEQAVGYNFSQFVSENIFSPQLSLNSKNKYQISFARCTQELLLKGQICADQEIMNKLFNQRGNELQVNVILNIVDQRTFKEQQIKKHMEQFQKKQNAKSQKLGQNCQKRINYASGIETFQDIYLQMQLYEMNQTSGLVIDQYSNKFTGNQKFLTYVQLANKVLIFGIVKSQYFDAYNLEKILRHFLFIIFGNNKNTFFSQQIYSFNNQWLTLETF